jgi:hypothetical protein
VLPLVAAPKPEHRELHEERGGDEHEELALTRAARPSRPARGLRDLSRQGLNLYRRNGNGQLFLEQHVANGIDVEL